MEITATADAVSPVYVVYYLVCTYGMDLQYMHFF